MTDIWSDLQTAQPVHPAAVDVWGDLAAGTTAPVGQQRDPSAGGGELRPFGIDTGIQTPQWLDRALSGAGKGLTDLVRGAGQMVGAESRQDVAESRQLDKPLMSTTAGKVGDVAGTAAGALPAMAIPGANSVIGASVVGAGLGLLQPSTSTGETVTNVGLGALGGVAGSAGGKLIKGVLGGFGGSPTKDAALAILDAEGIPTTVGQRTGSKLAQTIERTSAITSDAPAEFAGKQNTAFNQAVLKRIGVADPNVTAATPDVLSDARDAITGVMNDVASRTNVKVDDPLLNDLSEVEHSATRQLPASDAGPIRQNLSDILENASQNNGSLDGTFVQKLRANISALAKNPSTAPVAGDLQDALDGALQRSADPKDLAALTTARQQYRALKQIEPAVDPATGNISVGKLMNSLAAKSNRNQALYGQGDQSLMDLARAAKSVLVDPLGNSGTAERMLQPVGAMEALASGHPMEAGAKLLVGRAGLNAAGRAMRNQGAVGNYLTSGIPGARGAAELAPTAGAASGIGLSNLLHGNE